MARQLADAAPSAAPAAGRRVMTRKIVVALGLVLVGQALFALCLVSAQQLLVPRNMPFGVAGPPSPVVAAVASKAGLDLSAYPEPVRGDDRDQPGRAVRRVRHRQLR